MTYDRVAIRKWQKANPDKVRANLRRWYHDHRDDLCAKKRAYRKANLEKVRAQEAASYRRNRKTKQAISAAWRKANPERFYANVVAWRKANPSKVYQHSKKREILKRSVRYIEHTPVMPRDKKCPHCRIKMIGKWPERNTPTEDHIKPLARGGHHVPSNTQIICHSCNMIKGHRSITYLKQQLELRVT